MFSAAFVAALFLLQVSMSQQEQPPLLEGVGKRVQQNESIQYTSYYLSEQRGLDWGVIENTETFST